MFPKRVILIVSLAITAICISLTKETINLVNFLSTCRWGWMNPLIIIGAVVVELGIIGTGILLLLPPRQ